MAIKELLKQYNEGLRKYNLLIGLIVIFLLITLIIATFKNFEKQNQIIETGGFIDGNIKCVCSQDAWDTCAYSYLTNVTIYDLNLGNYTKKDGK